MLVERWNTEFLTQPLTSFRSGDCLQVWTFDVGENVLAAPDECVVRHAWVAVGDDFDFWRDTTNFTIERYGIVIGRCSTANTICEVSLSSDFGAAESDIAQSIEANSDIRLFITDASIILMNTSENFIDVSKLVFESSAGLFAATRWQIPELSTPLYALPAAGCLQVWAVNEEYLAAPRSCSIRHVWIAVAFDAQFWRNTSVFTVRSENEVIAACQTQTEICDFDLP
jgi:hypothetical protein